MRPLICRCGGRARAWLSDGADPFHVNNESISSKKEKNDESENHFVGSYSSRHAC